MSLLRMLCSPRLRRLRVVRASVVAVYLVLAFVFVVALLVRVERQGGDDGGGGGSAGGSNGLPWEADQGEETLHTLHVFWITYGRKMS